MPKQKQQPPAVERLIARFNDKTSYRRHTDQSRKWFRTEARKLGRVTTSQMVRQPDRYKAAPLVGQMMLWNYDPKHKNNLKKLPYYDSWPLSFIVSVDGDGFTALNMHYLSPVARQLLFKELLTLRNDKRYRDSTRLDQITWERLKTFTNSGFAKAAVKRYLWTHVRSKFVRIPSNEWEVVVFLPLERFNRASNRRVWNDSNRIARNG